MMKPDPKTLLKDVEDIARDAGAAIMKYYNGENEAHVYIKNDGSPVTDADKASEDVILPRLAALTPGIPIVSEESFEGGARPDTSGGTFWTVDPLDGTKEFTARTGAFVVAISLIVDHKPVLGVIYHPAFGIMYSAAGPGTAEKTSADGTRTKLQAAGEATDDLRVVLNQPSTDVERVKGYLSVQFNSASPRIDSKPGILREMQVAENDADLAFMYPLKRGGRTKWWDIAPAHAIIEAAGGKVEGVDGKPIVYDAADYMVPPIVSISPRRAAHKSGSGMKPSS